ncbi:MAG TPA: hypothetical protein VM900_08850 [Sphingomonas sp.]|jgi:hypothetical protein|nr:hypothetical protein [Sphingomonas sp.]
MRITFAGILADAWALFRRDSDLLLRVAGPFLFLPAFALTLFVPPMPMPDRAILDRDLQAQQWADAVTGWVGGYGLGFCAAYLLVYFGTAVIIALYCDPERPDLRGALRRAGSIYPRFLLATILISIPAGLGMWLVIPGLYILARTMLAAPTLLADPGTGAWAAIKRSLVLTRGSGLTLLGLAAFVYLIGLLGGQPFMMLDGWMRGTGAPNPIAVTVVDAAAAAVAMVTQLALALIAIATHRRLAR